MMTHDPFQNYQAFGAYPGLPYTAFQPFVNPSAAAGQPLSNPGIGGYGIYPQPFQGAGSQSAGIGQLFKIWGDAHHIVAQKRQAFVLSFQLLNYVELDTHICDVPVSRSEGFFKSIYGCCFLGRRGFPH